MERDRTYICYTIDTVISTHTLTWSVTGIQLHESSESEDFNSHAHVERDSLERRAIHNHSDFNSHAHVERDRFYGYVKILN